MLQRHLALGEKMVYTGIVYKGSQAMVRSVQLPDFISGEGRCPVVPLVFKTSDRVFREFNEDRGLAITPYFFSV
jgi:hypothetical protein